MKRKDERDILFARASYKKGTPMHKDYYSRHPEKLEFDEKFRERSLMGDKNSAFYNNLISPIPFSVFDFLADIKPFSEGNVSKEKTIASKEEFTKILKGIAYYYGAKHVRVVKLLEDDYYSHRARPAEDYSKIIEPKYKYGIAFTVEMQEDLINTAPNVPQSVATTKGYMDAAVIGMVLSYYIRNLGYEARNNMDGNYLMPLINIFQRAGIGEIGVNGLLLTKEYGPRVRLGLVSTNIPLVEDDAEKLYIREFCNICKRCMTNCPPKAIKNTLEEFDDEICISMWQHFGSDCGICMSSCPFSHNLPLDLISDLSSGENMSKLRDYCNEHFPHKKITRKETPHWLDVKLK